MKTFFYCAITQSLISTKKIEIIVLSYLTNNWLYLWIIKELKDKKIQKYKSLKRESLRKSFKIVNRFMTWKAKPQNFQFQVFVESRWNQVEILRSFFGSTDRVLPLDFSGFIFNFLMIIQWTAGCKLFMLLCNKSVNHLFHSKTWVCFSNIVKIIFHSGNFFSAVNDQPFGWSFFHFLWFNHQHNETSGVNTFEISFTNLSCN